MPPDRAAELSRTVPAAEFGENARPAPAPKPTASEPRSVPRLPGSAVVAHRTQAEDQPRWRVGSLIGSGATAQVYAVVDHNLEREVAVKVLPDRSDERELERFLTEARIAASLQHPSVIPVHELGADGDGRLFYAMKKVEGRSLAQELEAPGRGRMGSVNTLVSAFIDLCSALAYAHHHGVVHQDIKPENVMLGDFGEVLLVDWGSAVEVGTDGRVVAHLYGTPLYMSPEQARQEYADARSDLYCLGGTMLHALTGRLPVWRDDQHEFWECKRRGAIDRPTATETASVPRELLAIAVKALAVDPAARYQSAKEMLADLERYQAGLAVSALREPLLARAMRWYRANRMLAWASGTAIAAVAAVGGVIAHERALESSSWHEVYRCDFSRPMTAAELARDWRVSTKEDWDKPLLEAKKIDSLLATRGGELELSSSIVTDLSPRVSLLGDLRVEWTYRDLDNNHDLNCFVGGTDRDHAYVMHIGGFGDPGRCVLSRGAEGAVLQDRLGVFIAEKGRAYRFAVEKVGQRIRLWIDDGLIFDYVDYGDPEWLSQRGFGFESCTTNRLGIDDIVAYRKPLALRVSPLAVPDELFRDRQYEDAARRYEELVDCYPGTEVADIALLRQAQCTARRSSSPGDELDVEAETLLGRFLSLTPPHALEPVALVERWMLARRRGDATAAAALIPALERHRGHPILCSVLHEQARAAHAELQRGVAPRAVGGSSYPRGIELMARDRLRALREQARRFGLDVGSPPLESDALLALDWTGHPEWMLDLLHPGEEHYAEVLLACGRYDELLAGYHHVPWLRLKAMYETGRHDDDLLAQPGASGWLQAPILLERGEIEQARAQWDTRDLGQLLVRAGLYDEAVGHLDAGDHWRHEALLRLGRLDEVIASQDDPLAAYALVERGDYAVAEARDPGAFDALYLSALKQRGTDKAASDRLFTALADCANADAVDTLDFAHLVMWPVLRALDGEDRDLAGGLRRVLEEHHYMHAQRPWHLAAFITGRIDEAAFRAQPYGRHLEARTIFAQALRADCRGERAVAADAYAKYLALPAWKRPPDIIAEAFAGMRSRALVPDR